MVSSQVAAPLHYGLTMVFYTLHIYVLDTLWRADLHIGGAASDCQTQCGSFGCLVTFGAVH